MKYFISDLHFGHANILRFERTEFATIEEHDQFIIDTINKKVKMTDTLYILGDIGNVDKVRYLNGRKILLLGNHDTQSAGIYRSFFSEVYEHPFYFNKRILLSHHPHPVDAGVLNVHGHLHGSRLDSNNHMNLSAAMIGYKPVDENMLNGVAGSLEKDNHIFLEEWYANLYVFDKPEERNDVVTDIRGRVLLAESRRVREKIKKDKLGFVIDVFKKDQV